MDGWSLVRRLRSSARFALVPVIFLSQQSRKAARLEGFRLGADDFVPKGDLTDLPARIAAALQRRHRLEQTLRSAPRG
jgi:DNA-binding response OmpR family regulator